MVTQGAAYFRQGLDRQGGESGIPKRGWTLANAQHITASAFTNDDESGLHHDYEVWLEELAPHAAIDQYWHNRTGRGRLSRMDRKADAHMKRQIMGREVVVIWALTVHGRDIAEL